MSIQNRIQIHTNSYKLIQINSNLSPPLSAKEYRVGAFTIIKFTIIKSRRFIYEQSSKETDPKKTERSVI